MAMKLLSLKLRQEIFEEVEKVIRVLHVPRNAYINEALEFYNRLNERRRLRKKLQKESRAVWSTSLEVLREFEKLEDNRGL